MVTLRVVLDSPDGYRSRGVGRYSTELTRSLVERAPRDCDVEAVVPSSSQDDVDAIRKLVPGLSDIHRSPLGRRETLTAWKLGVPGSGPGGMVHAPSLDAPLLRHDRRATPGEQTVVTIHDASPWLFPDAHSPRQRKLAKRAQRHADAIVVPTHATADALSRFIDFGDRVRVIGGATSRQLALPDDIDEVVSRLELPESFVLVTGTLEPRKNVESLFAAAARSTFPDVPVIFVGEGSWGDRTVEQAIFESVAPEGRIRWIPPLSDQDLAVVLSRATLFAHPSLHEGFGLAAIEALQIGTPVVHSDTPALMEVVAGAGISVPLSTDDFPTALAEAIGRAFEDPQTLQRLSVQGKDRARAFTWSDSADRVWQLHAEL